YHLLHVIEFLFPLLIGLRRDNQIAAIFGRGIRDSGVNVLCRHALILGIKQDIRQSVGSGDPHVLEQQVRRVVASIPPLLVVSSISPVGVQQNDVQEFMQQYEHLVAQRQGFDELRVGVHSTSICCCCLVTVILLILDRVQELDEEGVGYDNLRYRFLPNSEH